MPISKSTALAILVAALGYFVDVYDLILFSVVRRSSLISLGVAEDQLLTVGVDLINMQMIGMLAGGILWGVLGDKRGRISVLFGSILLYSAANIANGFVNSVEWYAIWRLIAGIGLAGELGAGITLVSEVMPKETRGYATTLVATVGVGGAVAASLIGDFFDWRTAYFVGGAMGLALLVLRVSVVESGMFHTVRESCDKRGDLILLFSSWGRTLRYLCCTLIGLPIWYAIGILVTFSPEIGAALKMPELPSPGRAVLFAYIGLLVGDLISGVLSQILRSRNKVIRLFIVLSGLGCLPFFMIHEMPLKLFYPLCFLIGTCAGYWAVFVTTAAEQFGTNLRATVTTTVPNFVRGAVVPMTISFRYLDPAVGVLASAMIVGAVSIILALVSAFMLKETFGRDLNFIEE